MHHWHDIYVVNKERLKDIRSEAVRERLARQISGRESRPGRMFVQLLMAVLAALGLVANSGCTR